MIGALYAALSKLPSDQHVKYTRIARAAFTKKAYERLEALIMADTTERRESILDAIEAEGEARGEARGEAKMLLLILEQRGIALDESDRERIIGCTDLEQLQYWGTRAFQVDSAERLFA
ncbi:hypothetical protein GCM10029992_41400 [Glycomyces albus]